MSEKKLYQRLINASKALAYWSKELLKANAEIEKRLSLSNTKATGKAKQERKESDR